MSRASQSALARRLDAPKKKPKKKISNAARRLLAPRHPVAVELYLVQAARRLVRLYARAVWAEVQKIIPDFARQPRTDAKGKDPGPQIDEARRVTSHMRTVARRALARGLPAFESRSKTAADRAQGHSQKELDRLGLKVKEEPELKHLVSGWRKDNVARIKGLADHQLDQIEAILANGENRDPESIANDIKELVTGVSDRRAEFIARDQVLTLNSQINSHRQQAAGVESYVWTSQADDRVREAHADLDGEEFDWESGGDPDEGHPGEPVNCRCVASPIPPEESGEEETDDAEE